MSKPRILIVDDDPENAARTQAAVEQIGCAAETAGSVPEGLTALGKSRFDLVVTSMLLPGLGGLELLRLLREAKDELLYAIPVVVLTRCKQPEYQKKARELGAADYILKPYQLPDLQARIRRVLESQGVRWPENE